MSVLPRHRQRSHESPFAVATTITQEDYVHPYTSSKVTIERLNRSNTCAV